MDPVVHFEMPYEDRERMAEFYRNVFGWKTEMLGEEMDRYVLATTVGTEPKGRRRSGAINGGFYKRKPDWPAQYPSIVIAVKDVEKAAAKVFFEGGTVLGEPMEIPGVGSYLSFLDTEGNRVSMLQPVMGSRQAQKVKPKKRVVTKAVSKKGAKRLVTKQGRKK
jgi:predicted enzyme related to lactoylglutathione lyase